MVRTCFLTNELIFFAEERAKRPYSFRNDTIKIIPKEVCPFCVNNEYMTPKKVYANNDNSIRIVPNKYPFVSTDDKSNFGVHDVLIDTALHDEIFGDFSEQHILEVLKTIRMRIEYLEKLDEIKYVQVFKNQGFEAGASQSHSHWQIASLSVVPPKCKMTMDILSDYFGKNKTCYFCNMEFDNRIIEENKLFVAFTPFASRFPYEISIMSKKHIHDFALFDDADLQDLSIILKHSISRLSSLFSDISYNICFHNAPKINGVDDYMHFYVEIIPRMGNMAGFEFSTGCYINSILPENAAEILRNSIN